MTSTQFEQSLLNLAAEWRQRAHNVETKFAHLNAAQTQVATEALNNCAAELEAEVAAFRRSRPAVK